jgi:hypothetical protein
MMMFLLDMKKKCSNFQENESFRTKIIRWVVDSLIPFFCLMKMNHSKMRQVQTSLESN